MCVDKTERTIDLLNQLLKENRFRYNDENKRLINHAIDCLNEITADEIDKHFLKPHPRHDEIFNELVASINICYCIHEYKLSPREIDRIFNCLARQPKVVIATLRQIDAADKDGIIHSPEGDQAIEQFHRDVTVGMTSFVKQFVLNNE